MKIFGYEINFSIKRVKTIILNIPTKADDIHIKNMETKGLKIFDPDWDLTPDGNPKLCYFSSLLNNQHFIDLPKKTKYAKKVYLTPRTQIINNKKVYSKNRICVVNCYF